MSRLRLQCLLGSAALHGLLLVVFVVGSGFRAPHHEPEWETMPVLDFVPTRLVDGNVMGGGDPRGMTAPPPVLPRAADPAPRPEPAQPPPPAPPRQPERQTPSPEPVKTPPKKPAAPDPEALSETGTKKATSKPKIEVSKKLVTRRPRDDAASRKKAAQQAEAEAEAERARWAERTRQVRSGQLSGAVTKLQGSLSGRSVVAVPYGPGGGGETYAGYGLYVRYIYERAWRPPTEAPDGSRVVTARVVIARDGKVVRAEIVSKSGAAALDKSVATVLGRVTTIGRPFPDSSPDEQKTFLIDFDLQAKRSTG